MSLPTSSLKPALCLIGHGSRDAEGTHAFASWSKCFSEMLARIVEGGFLEFAEPIIATAFDRCVDRGAKSIVVLPGMLTAAGHTKIDIPREIEEARRRHPQIDFRYAAYSFASQDRAAFGAAN